MNRRRLTFLIGVLIAVVICSALCHIVEPGSEKAGDEKIDLSATTDGAVASDTKTDGQCEHCSQEAKKRDAGVVRKTNTAPITLTGEVIDTWCYCSEVMGEGRGPSHEKCARLCVVGGVSAGILTDDGKVYIAAKHQGYKGCNGLLLPYVAKRVRVVGWVAERGGVRVLKIKKVEPLEKSGTNH